MSTTSKDSVDQACKPVLLTIKDGYAIITLNRPKQLNSFNEEMHFALQDAMSDVETNDDIRCLLITGAGRGFCAGQDLGDRDPRKQTYDLSQTLTTFYNPLVRRLEALPKPIIIAVNGVTAGAGIGLMLTADIAMCSHNAKFAMAFGKIGLIPDCSLTWRLVRLLGVMKAKALALTNATLTAEEALDNGLVWQVFNSEILMERAEELAKNLAYGSATSMKLTIQAMNQAQTNTLEEQLELEAKYQQEAGFGEDYTEGVSAFLEKRNAIFYKKP